MNFYLQFDNSANIDYSRTDSTDYLKWIRADIVHTKKCEIVFWSFSSVHLPRSITQSDTVIINANTHTERGSHWLAIHFRSKSSSGYFFDSYGIYRFFPVYQRSQDANLRSGFITRDKFRA